jgi:hypothetical protein
MVRHNKREGEMKSVVPMVIFNVESGKNRRVWWPDSALPEAIELAHLQLVNNYYCCLPKPPVKPKWLRVVKSGLSGGWLGR